jgi:hypothetical protein
MRLQAALSLFLSTGALAQVSSAPQVIWSAGPAPAYSSPAPAVSSLNIIQIQNSARFVDPTYEFQEPKTCGDGTTYTVLLRSESDFGLASPAQHLKEFQNKIIAKCGPSDFHIEFVYPNEKPDWMTKRGDAYWDGRRSSWMIRETRNFNVERPRPGDPKCGGPYFAPCKVPPACPREIYYMNLPKIYVDELKAAVKKREAELVAANLIWCVSVVVFGGAGPSGWSRDADLLSLSHDPLESITIREAIHYD